MLLQGAFLSILLRFDANFFSYSLIQAVEQDTKTANHKKAKDHKEAKDDKETKDNKKAGDFKETEDDKGTKGIQEETQSSKEVQREKTEKGAGHDIELVAYTYNSQISKPLVLFLLHSNENIETNA